MATETLYELDEVEGLDVSGEAKTVKAEDYDLPLARTIRAIQYDESLSNKVWLGDSELEEVLALFDLSDENKDILRSRDIQAMHEALIKEREAIGLPKDMHIVWALVRIENTVRK